MPNHKRRCLEALARVIAEKNNPRIDVLFGGEDWLIHAAPTSRLRICGIRKAWFAPNSPPRCA